MMDRNLDCAYVANSFKDYQKISQWAYDVCKHLDGVCQIDYDRWEIDFEHDLFCIYTRDQDCGGFHEDSFPLEWVELEPEEVGRKWLEDRCKAVSERKTRSE